MCVCVCCVCNAYKMWLFYRQLIWGKRSGHGRVVYLYFELCEKLWGGSPATEKLGTVLYNTLKLIMSKLFNLVDTGVKQKR